MVSFKRPLALGERNVALSTSKSFSLLKGTQTVTLFTMKPSAGFIFKVRHVLKIEVSFIASTPKSYGAQCGSGLFQARKTFTARLIYLNMFCLMQ